MSAKYFLLYSSLLIAVAFTFYMTTSELKGKYHQILISFIITLHIWLSSFFLIANYFTGKGVNDAVFFHLNYGLVDAGFSEYWAVIVAGVFAFILSLFAPYYILKLMTRYSVDKASKARVYLLYISFVASFAINPASAGIAEHYQLSSILEKERTDLDRYFVTSSIYTKIPNKKNIIWIYAESLEYTYFNEDTFPGLVPNLKIIESNAVSFRNIKQVVNTGFTIGGIVASQCGTPLFSSSTGNTNVGMDEFLPNATCLGDILSENGWDLSFMGGASLGFAGKGKFFKSHGFQNVLGLHELENRLENKEYRNGWGLYDDSLFDFAWKQLQNHQNTKDPFGLFLLTLDTHHPVGHESSSCLDIKKYGDGNNPMLNAVHCSDYLISKFINKVINSKFYENTIIVISSDHLAMRNTAFNTLETVERSNMFLVLNSGLNAKVNSKSGSTLDIAPTILSLLGADSNVGLGKNLLSKAQSFTTIFEDYNKVLMAWKKSLIHLWGFPEFKPDAIVEINTATKELELSGEKFIFPLLLKVNDKNESTFSFEHGLVKGWETYRYLQDYVGEMKSGTKFLYIDECKKMKSLKSELAKIRESSICIMHGISLSSINIKVLDSENYKFTYEELFKI